MLLLFAGGNGRYCSLATVAEIGEGISDASQFLDAPTFGPALLLYVRAACFSSRRDLGQSCLAHVGKVCDMLLEATSNAEVSRFDVGASFDFLQFRPEDSTDLARNSQEVTKNPNPDFLLEGRTFASAECSHGPRRQSVGQAAQIAELNR